MLYVNRRTNSRS